MVKPKCLNTSLAGPDAPNDRMPARYCACTTPRSTQPRRRAPARRSGRSVARNAGCQGVGDAAAPAVEAAQHLQLVLERLLVEEFPEGIDTGACARRPAPPRRRCSAALRAGRRSRAPGRRRSAAGDVRAAAHRFGRRARGSTPRRESARTVGVPAAGVRGDGIWGRRAVGEWRGVDVFGVPRFSRASMYGPTPFASAERSVGTFGVARRLIVPPRAGASARPQEPIESCVATKITPHLDSADTRIAPSAYPVKLRNVPQNGRMAPYLQQGHEARLGRRGVAWGRAFPSWRRTTPARCKSPPWRAHARRSGCTSPRASPPGSPLRPSAS